MSYFDDEEDLHDEGLCDPEFCRFCKMEEEEAEMEEDEETEGGE